MSVNTMASGDYFPITAIGTGIMIGSSTYGTTPDLKLPENKDFQEITGRLAEIEKRLAILHPNEELQSRFPALQEAYDHYKLIEKLVNDKNIKE